MQHYEYKIVPAPAKGTKAKGVKSGEARFAHSIELLLNQLAADGWEYQRAELLPCEERSGLTGTATSWRNVLVFRRPAQDAFRASAPDAAPEPAKPAKPAPRTPVLQRRHEPEPVPLKAIEGGASKSSGKAAGRELGPMAGIAAALKSRTAQGKAESPAEDADRGTGTDTGAGTPPDKDSEGARSTD